MNTDLQNSKEMRKDKLQLFEFIVCELDSWRKSLGCSGNDIMTKLRLQKILFLVATVNATENNHKLLDVFDRFYALPYGPVEMDIYEAMKEKQFEYLTFIGNNCYIADSEKEFSLISDDLKNEVQLSIEKLKQKKIAYLTQPVFDLVDLTHRWSAWQIAMEYANLIGANRATLSTSDILSSTKFF